MPATVTSLWPDDIKVDVVPPLVILNIQAESLTRLTRGIVRGEVATTTGPDDFVSYRLELVAPSLGGRRHGVLNVTHRANFYPLVLEADCLRPQKRPVPRHAGSGPPPSEVAEGWVWPKPDDWRPVAANQNEFLKLLGEVLKSREVRAAIDTMIATYNERVPRPDSDVAAEPAA